MVYKTFVKVTKSSRRRRYQGMKIMTGAQGIVMPVDAWVFSFTGTDPVSSGVCAVGRAALSFSAS
jgi:hypothetical protein